MEGEGHINTSFLTTKLPTWAGVRQNVTGSDLNGRPVPAFIPPAEVRAAEHCGLSEYLQGSAPSPPAAAGTMDSTLALTESGDVADQLYESLKSALEGIKVQLSELMKSMKRFEDRLELVEDELESSVVVEQEVEAVVDMDEEDVEDEDEEEEDEEEDEEAQ